jgi:hypothetical protein
LSRWNRLGPTQADPVYANTACRSARRAPQSVELEAFARRAALCAFEADSFPRVPQLL